MKTVRQVKAMREDAARVLFALEGAEVQDEGDLPEERAARVDRLRIVVDVCTEILTD